MRLLLLSAGTLATCLPAQLPSVAPTIIEHEAHSSSSGLFGEFEVVNVTGFGIPDAAYIRGGRPYLMAIPAWMSVSVPMVGVPAAQDTYSIRAVPRAGQANDAVALVGAYGLGLWSYDLVTDTPLFQLIDATWNNVTHLDVGDFDGDGAIEAIGVEGTVVRFARLFGAGPVPPALQFSSPVLTASLFDYDTSTAVRELGVVTEDVIQVFTSGVATPVTVYNGGGSFTQAHSIRVPEPSGELMASVVEWQSGGNSVVSIAPNAGQVAHYVVPGAFPGGLASGVGTPDDWDDLVMTRADGTIEMYYNLHAIGSPVPFQPSWGGASSPLPAGPTGAEVVRPAMADFDGDGDGDILLGYDALNPKLVLLDNGIVNPNPDLPDVGTPTFVHDGYAHEGTGELMDMDLRIPDVPATHLQIFTWEVRSEVDAPGADYRLIPTSGSVNNVTLPIAIVNGDEMHVDDLGIVRELDPSGPPHFGGFFIAIRLVDNSVSPPTLYPARLAAVRPTTQNWDVVGKELGPHPSHPDHPDHPEHDPRAPLDHQTITPLPHTPPILPPENGDDPPDGGGG